MSYDITLIDPVTKEVLKTSSPHMLRGHTYCLNDTDEMWINITYNYHPGFTKAFDNKEGIHILEGMMAADSIPLISKGIERLSDEVDPDPWKCTDGNVKSALYKLLAMAKLRPDGIWFID